MQQYCQLLCVQTAGKSNVFLKPDLKDGLSAGLFVSDSIEIFLPSGLVSLGAMHFCPELIILHTQYLPNVNLSESSELQYMFSNVFLCPLGGGVFLQPQSCSKDFWNLPAVFFTLK